MADKGIGSLVVTEDGDLRGIVTERDYARKVIIKGRKVPTDYVRIANITKKAGYRGYWPLETLDEGDPREKLKILYNVVKSTLD